MWQQETASPRPIVEHTRGSTRAGIIKASVSGTGVSLGLFRKPAYEGADDGVGYRRREQGVIPQNFWRLTDFTPLYSDLVNPERRR